MPTPPEIRQIRLKNDYAQMCNIRGNIIQWEAKNGKPPFVEEYHLTVKVKTIVGNRPDYADTISLKLQLTGNYPTSPPSISVLKGVKPFHPNWHVDGRWCYGEWFVNEGLGEHVLRMVKTLQYDFDITNAGSAANGAAGEWYLQKRRSGLFPCDKQPLPDPTTGKGTSAKTGGKKFEIKSIS